MPRREISVPSGATRWLVVVTFAVAMAFVEAATVYYLRLMIGRVEPYQANPLPIRGALGAVELWREAATLVMLAAAGILAGRGWRAQAGYAALAFGMWDIFYYVFLRAICDWPKSLLDWDILFLLPLPWWGPVLAPVCISVLMIAWGTAVTRIPDAYGTPFGRVSLCSGAAGAGVALYVFMADSLRDIRDGFETVGSTLPTWFNWPLFSIALALMALPVARAIRRTPDRAQPVNSSPAPGCRGIRAPARS